MPYYNVTPHTLYQSALSSSASGYGYLVSDPLVMHKCWHESLNIYHVWEKVQEWFELMESGDAENRYPDPFWNDADYPDKTALTQDVADEFIAEMDADFMLEKSRFQGRLVPEFSRLPPHSRMAFVQDMYKIIITSAEIERRAIESMEAGLTLPPKNKQEW